MTASTLSKLISEIDWKAVSVVGGFCLSAVLAFGSLKSDVRDLSTQFVALQKQSEVNGAELSKLRDMFIQGKVATR